ncbi:hypothetical protein HMPREF9436_01599 [Faecalibacterium cf. prausnitzii KLE1255]|uniref:Uncharacterized protein n=1 Tax=Faecalibacterium cf. prausnitzii KLE1255 TaxID=748224 RepID=E2ZIV4_9FIRM|nr:hypothetical protein HMPREF9436_01599 [Faecalibacterium cf. prausnitzii KLE1255]
MHKSTKNAAFSGGVFLLCRKESEKALSSLCAGEYNKKRCLK